MSDMPFQRLARPLSCVLFACAAIAEIAVVTQESAIKLQNNRASAAFLGVISFDARTYTAHAEDPQHAVTNLQRAVRLNPWDTTDSLLLSAELEASGQISQARDLLLQAEAHDAGLAPKWALANFELRHERRDKFFCWANKYRAMSLKPRAGIFRLALEAGSSLDDTLQQLGPVRCGEVATLLALADERGLASEALNKDMFACRDPQSLTHWAQHISRLLQKDQPRRAHAEWLKLGFQDTLFNSDFASSLSEEGFDWRINRTPSVIVRQDHDEHGIQIHVKSGTLDGSILIFQPIAPAPGQQYELDVATQPASAAESIEAELVELVGGRILHNAVIAVQNTSQQKQWLVDAPPSDKSLVLALIYRTPQVGADDERSFVLKQVDLHPAKSSK